MDYTQQHPEQELPLTYVGANDKYTIQTLIDEGSFGQVFRAILTLNPTKLYAIKVEEVTSKPSCLLAQCRIYRQLQQQPPKDCEQRSFVPKIYYCAKQDDHNVLVMQLMGPSLKKLLLQKQVKTKQNSIMRLQMRTVLLLAEQMISALEYIHNRGIVHRDLKPANFCIGHGANKNQIFIVDFGLATRYKVNGRHIPQGKVQGIIGNRTYASIACHHLHQQSRKDDLESLAYILVDLAIGGLPWKKLSSDKKTPKFKTQNIGRQKAHTDPNVLCQGLHKSFVCYLQAVRQLKFEEQPSYEFYKNLFRFAMYDLGLDRQGDDLFE